MANFISFPLQIVLTGDGVSLNATVALAVAPTSVSLVSAYGPTGADVSSNIASVNVLGSTIVFTFNAVFTGAITVEVALASANYNSLPAQPVLQTTSPWVVNGSAYTQPANVAQVAGVVLAAPTAWGTAPSGVVIGGNVELWAGAISLVAKAASIAPLTTDPALVVTLSPNAGLGTPAVPMVVSLGNTDAKTAEMLTGELTTTTVTANQVVLTYTVTAGKTFYLEYLSFSAEPSSFATNVALGIVSFQAAAVSMFTMPLEYTAVAAHAVTFTEPIPFAAGTVLRVVTTPAATTSTMWFANFGGYER
jgi:hypothetical protein